MTMYIRRRDQVLIVRTTSMLSIYNQIIVAGSLPHFAAIDAFLKNPRNRLFTALYHDAADELKAKILATRGVFATFDEVFAFIYEQIQAKRSSLKGKRRMI